MKKLFFLLLISSYIGCGQLLSPTDELISNNELIVIQAHKVAEQLLGHEIDISQISIFIANETEIERCGIQSAGCYQNRTIYISNLITDEQNKCMVLAHELVHAGADINGMNTDHDHVIYNWHMILGHKDCTIL